jgi:hypothetical protein
MDKDAKRSGLAVLTLAALALVSNYCSLPSFTRPYAPAPTAQAPQTPTKKPSTSRTPATPKRTTPPSSGYQTVRACVLNTEGHPVAEERIDAAIKYTQNELEREAHKRLVVVTDRKPYKAESALPLVGGERARNPHRFCPKPHDITIVFTDEVGPKLDSIPILGYSRPDRSYALVFRAPSDRARNISTLHEVLHVFGAQHSQRLESIMYASLGTENKTWTSAERDAARKHVTFNAPSNNYFLASK